MNRIVCFLCAWVLLTLLCACTRRPATPDDLLRADSLSETENPLSAAACLDSLSDKYGKTDGYERMKYELLRIKARDKAYIPIRNDSAIRDIVGFMERYGTQGDVVESLYYLGGFYRDNNDYPHAIESYRRVLGYQDMPDASIDRNVFACTYGQLSEIHTRLVQLDQALEDVKNEYRYFSETGRYGFGKELYLGRMYLLAGKKDSAAIYYGRGFEKLPGGSLSLPEVGGVAELMGFYVSLGDRAKAGACMAILNQFNPDSLPANAWSDKALYHERYGEPDSAEYYLLLYHAHPRGLEDVKGTASRLFRLYKKRGDWEKAVEYADVYDRICDSITIRNNRQASINADNFFQYSKSRQEEAETKERALRYWAWGWAATAAVLLLCLVMLLGRRYYAARIRQSEEEQRILQGKLKELEERWGQQMQEKGARAGVVSSVREMFAEAGYRSGKLMDAGLWQKLYDSVDAAFPDFAAMMQGKKDVLPEETWKVCYMLRAGLKQADIARLRNHSRTTALRHMRLALESLEDDARLLTDYPQKE